jgi:hypothetical protein
MGSSSHVPQSVTSWPRILATVAIALPMYPAPSTVTFMAGVLCSTPAPRSAHVRIIEHFIVVRKLAAHFPAAYRSMTKGATPMRVPRAVSAVTVAREKPVVIGEVSSQVARRGIDYAALVRLTSEEELRALDWSHVPHGKRVIASIALVRLDTFEEPRTTDSTCEISATLRDARGGTVFAILEGKARAKTDGASTSEIGALRGALHGALARIPEVLRR